MNAANSFYQFNAASLFQLTSASFKHFGGEFTLN